ncbi:SusC/RagA family TonB-linked outer membrane protein [Larkinella punicea]|uniref:TonB-dependent receptor n=1 Tax=Larkinella punicea TaxID=2315727 RepID=A0A368JMC4_9BACT|nr:TonB-dependent receptor [Larkinella punicea]RCR68435.1 TonB-dependent receptor [Larkinella punicea]
MKKTVHHLGLLAVLLIGYPVTGFCQTLASAQHLQRSASRSTQTQLKNILLDLQRHYRVEIVFEDRIMAGKNVPSEPVNLNVSVEKNLHNLLKNTGLRVKKIRKDTFVITEERKTKNDLSNRTPETESEASSPAATPVDERTDGNATESVANHQPVVADLSISGTVIDESGAGLPGVSVVLKGTTRGTTTDSKGFYQVNVPDEKAVLVFSFVGYISQEVTVGNRSTVGVKLENDTKSLSEVVVVGYGTQKKVNLTGAVSSISNEELVRRPVGQTSAALQGMMPGVTVTQRSGRPGADGGSIRIRGVGTLGNSDPLVLIDGIEGSMNSIDPNLIETVSVLKDAASSSIYGSRAANGVILITTKRAKGNRISVNYNNYIGWQTPTNLPKMANAIDHMLLTNEAYVNVGRSPLYSDDLIQKYRTEGASNRDLYPDTDWQKEVLTGSGLQQSHFVSINGGSDKIRFLTSVGYFDQKGVIENSTFRRYTLRNNADIQLSKKFSARVDLQLVAATTLEPGRGSEEVFHWMNRIPANQIGINSNGTWGDGWNGDNPIAMSRDGGTRKNNSPYAFLNAALVYKPTSFLTAEIAYAPKYALSIDKNFNKAIQAYKPNGALSFLAPARSTLTEGNSRSMYTTLRGTLTFDKAYGDHGLKILAGFSREDFRNDNVSAYREGFLLPDYQVLNAGASDIQRASGGASEWALQSVFGRINYDYKQKYLLEANARYDGSSRFATGRKYGFFPSVSGGWRISQEPFMLPISNVVNELKLRASWGQLGNQLIGNYPFMSSLQFGPYTFNKQIVNVVALNTLANADISWETTEMTDIGLDMTLFSNLSITADYFSKRTKDILLELDIPAIIGLGKPSQNAGVVENKGWELGINYKGAVRNFRYDVGFNISDVKNKVIDMRGVNLTGLTANREGYPINSLFGLESEGFFQTADEVAAHAQQFGVIKPGDIKYKDQNGDGLINNDDNVVFGNTIPRFTYGSTLNAYYKGFSLNIVLQGVGKADGYLNEQGIMPFFLGGTVQEQHKDHWTPETPNATFPRLAFSEANNEKNSSFWMRNAAYMRLKNIQIGYTLPTNLTQRAGINNVRVFANGQNLLTWDKFWDGYDVESPVGSGRSYPQVKMVSFGLDVSF